MQTHVFALRIALCCLSAGWVGWGITDGACSEADQSAGTCKVGAHSAQATGQGTPPKAQKQQQQRAQQAQQPRVSCGAHSAPSCTLCPKGHGASWCHGDCVWAGNRCVPGSPTPPRAILQACEDDVRDLRARLALPRRRGSSQPPAAKPLVHGPKASALPDGRFPSPFSEEFDEICRPHLMGHIQRLELMHAGEAPVPDDVFYVAGPAQSEGVADFMQQSLNTFSRAVANDGGVHIAWKNVNLTDALVPARVDWHQAGDGLRARCNETPPCNVSQGAPSGNHIQNKMCGFLRNSYDPFRWMMQTKPNTNLSLISCAACFLNALYQPSPRISELVPQFSHLLSTITDSRTLSIGIYMRSNLSEGKNHNMSDADNEAARLPPRDTWTVDDRYAYYSTARCALQMEERWATGFDRVVWFVASDDSALRNTMIEEFSESASRADAEAGTASSRRSVISTNSHGRHSRPKSAKEQPGGKRKGHHRAAVEAFADWWLLGEVDLALIGTWTSAQSTFARTAFARGARARSTYIVAPEGRQNGHPRGLIYPREVYDCGNDHQFYHMWR